MSNIKQVAEAAGVSTATVSRVLNESGYVSEASRIKVREAIERLQYRPSAIARSLKQEKTNTIGVILPDISNAYFMSMAKGIERVTGAHGYQILFSSSDEDLKKEEHLLSLLYDKRVDVVVLVPCGEVSDDLKKLIDAGVPVIVADRILSDPSLPVDRFVENNRHASYELTCRLIEQGGHRRIGAVHGGTEVSTSRERLAGFHQALDRYGIPHDETLLYNGRYTPEGGAEAVAYFCTLKHPPTALLSLNNSMAYGALIELKQRGVRIPEQMAFASYGAIEGAVFLDSSQIWYVDQKPYDMGLSIGKRILEYQAKNKNRPTPIMRYVEHDLRQYT